MGNNSSIRKTGMYLQTKIILALVTIISLTIFLLGAVTIYYEKSLLIKELRQKGAMLADMLAKDAAKDGWLSDKTFLEAKTGDLAREGTISYIKISGKNGDVLAEHAAPANADELLKFSAPITAGNMKYGSIEIGLSTASLKQVVNKTIRTVTVMLVAAIVIMVLVIAFIIRKIVLEPIKNFTGVTAEISAGNLEKRIAVISDDEIGDLGTSFNEMVASLEQKTNELRNAKKEIEEHSRTLQLKIDERTKEIKEAHAYLMQAEKMAALGQLVGGVAHELNNPLGVILGFSQCICMKTKEGDPLYMPAKSIEREALRCKNLITNLLTFSRVTKLQKEEFDMNSAIDETLSLVETKTKVQNILIEKNYAQGDLKLTANKNLIQQVVMNLCNNAIDAMPGGGKLTVTTNRLENCVELYVQDTGRGITDEVKKHLFEPFFTTKEVGQGTGLGLSMCYEIIQKHNGAINAFSEPGKGTTFRVQLPVSA